ncbi:MAG: hypothetical protein HY870_15715 [Chloroflexi bacterium]|nr:hypothetical protein [Chloroflexota bacterium]
MSDQPEPPPPPPPPLTIGGGVNVGADDVMVGGSVVGRDQITSVGDDLIQGNVTNVTNVGLSPKAVQRLLITVGVLIFVTAACFFAGGIFVGANVFTALNKPIGSSLEAAASFEQQIADVGNLPPGETQWLRFTEDELSSYMKFILGPQIGLANARVRALNNGQYVVYGRYTDIGLPVMMVVEPQANSDQIVKINSASVHLVPFGGEEPGTISAVGWLPVPGVLVQPLVDRTLAQVGRQYRIINVAPSRPGPNSGAGAEGGLLIQAR